MKANFFVNYCNLWSETTWKSDISTPGTVIMVHAHLKMVQCIYMPSHENKRVQRRCHQLYFVCCPNYYEPKFGKNIYL